MVEESCALSAEVTDDTGKKPPIVRDQELVAGSLSINAGLALVEPRSSRVAPKSSR